MYESISKNNELENEMTLDMSYFWYSDVATVASDQTVSHSTNTQRHSAADPYDNNNNNN